MNSSQEILDIIIHYIDKSGKTEKECLISCGINTSFLTDWKKGKLKTPAYDKIVKLAIFLEIDIEWLFTGKEKRPSTELNDEDAAELMDIFSDLSEREKGELIGYARRMHEYASPENKEDA